MTSANFMRIAYKHYVWTDDICQKFATENEVLFLFGVSETAAEKPC